MEEKMIEKKEEPKIEKMELSELDKIKEQMKVLTEKVNRISKHTFGK